MQDEDKKEFAEVLGATMEIYGKDCSVPVMRMWWAALKEHSIEDVRKGLSRYIRSTDSGSFPPKPADILRMIEGSGQDRGMLAWSKVASAMGRVGAYSSVAFDDPIIHKVLTDMGGWVELCQGKEADQQFRANEFAKRYRAYCEMDGVREYPPYMIGLSEADNTSRGFKSEPPVLIGDPEKCHEVIKLGSNTPALKITKFGNIAALIGNAI